MQFSVCLVSFSLSLSLFRKETLNEPRSLRGKVGTGSILASIDIFLNARHNVPPVSIYNRIRTFLLSIKNHIESV